MPSSTDYILGGFQSLGQGVPGLMGELNKRQEASRLEQERGRQVHPALQKYMQAVLAGQMTPQEAGIRAKLETQQGTLPGSTGAVTPGMQVPTLGSESPLFGTPPPAAQSMLSPQGLSGAKPTMAPAEGSLMSGGSGMSAPSPAPGGTLSGSKPQVPGAGPSLLSGPASQPSAPLAQAPQERAFTVRDLEDFEKLRGFYQSQQASSREALRRGSVEREGEKGREARASEGAKKRQSAEDIAALAAGQRERASIRSFKARMAAIKSMEKMSSSKRQSAKDVLVFNEIGRNLRAERADITRKMVGAAQSLQQATSAQLLEEARKQLEELNKLEAAYAPVLKMMQDRTGLSEDELLAPLTGDEEETESIQRSTPLGARR